MIAAADVEGARVFSSQPPLTIPSPSPFGFLSCPIAESGGGRIREAGSPGIRRAK